MIRRSLRRPVDPALFSELLSQFHMVYHEAAQYTDQLAAGAGGLSTGPACW